MKRNVLCAIIFFIAGNGACQSLQNTTAGYLSMGTYGSGFADVFSFTVNQASLAQQKKSAVGLFDERKYLLPELNNYLAVFGLVTPSGNFGLKMNYAGMGLYNEMQVGLAHARKLGRDIDIGIQFNYNTIHIAGYGTASAIGFEIGSLFHLTRFIYTGIHISNPVGGKFGKYRQEKIPAIYTMGFGYEPSDKVLVSVEMIKEENQPVNINAGFYYKFLPQLFVRAGIATMTASPWMGFGFLWKKYRLDLYTSYHQQLGISPGLLLAFNLKNKVKDE